MFDLIIRNGRVVDGTGAPAFDADVAVKDGKIAQISSHITDPAAQELDATGQIVSPGFIDVHTHDDIVFDRDPFNLPKLQQGVTTVVVGNCGFGVAPAETKSKAELAEYNTPIFGEDTPKLLFDYFSQYIDHLKSIPKGQNVAALVPHGAIYIAVNGFHDRPMDESQLQKACLLVNDAMDAGAVGMSYGLMYAPGCYSSQQEIEALSQQVGKAGGIVTIHMKSESDHFDQSLDSAVALSKKCGVPVEISHLKNVGKKFWGKMAFTLDRLAKRLAEGADISFDMYPYTMGSTTMAILFPTEYMTEGVHHLIGELQKPEVRRAISQRLTESWGEEDNLSQLCGWENVIISSVVSEQNRAVLGKSVKQIAEARGVKPDQAFMDLFCEEQGEVSVLLNHIAQGDMEKTLLFDRVSLASDGLPGAKFPHPRLYGAFPKFLREFVREKRLINWENAIHKITQQPAVRFKLGARGVIREGYQADLVVFDPQTIADRATFNHPRQFPEGISYVFVNGALAVDHGVPGKIANGTFIARTS